MKRGELWEARLEPRSGSEQRGHRPVIALTLDRAKLAHRYGELPADDLRRVEDGVLIAQGIESRER